MRTAVEEDLIAVTAFWLEECSSVRMVLDLSISSFCFSAANLSSCCWSFCFCSFLAFCFCSIFLALSYCIEIICSKAFFWPFSLFLISGYRVFLPILSMLGAIASDGSLSQKPIYADPFFFDAASLEVFLVS